MVHGVTKEEFGLCGGVLVTHFWHNWQWLHQIEMAIQTIQQQIQWSQPLQEGRLRAQGQFSLIFVGARFQSAKPTADMFLGKQTSYCTPLAAPRVHPALDMHGQNGFIPTKSTCVFPAHPRSHICLGQKGFWWNEGHLHSVSFFLFALSFLSFAPHS